MRRGDLARVAAGTREGGASGRSRRRVNSDLLARAQDTTQSATGHISNCGVTLTRYLSRAQFARCGEQPAEGQGKRRISRGPCRTVDVVQPCQRPPAPAASVAHAPPLLPLPPLHSCSLAPTLEGGRVCESRRERFVTGFWCRPTARASLRRRKSTALSPLARQRRTAKRSGRRRRAVNLSLARCPRKGSRLVQWIRAG